MAVDPGSLIFPADDRPTKLSGFWTRRRALVAFTATTLAQLYLVVFLATVLDPKSPDPDEAAMPPEAEAKRWIYPPYSGVVAAQPGVPAAADADGKEEGFVRVSRLSPKDLIGRRVTFREVMVRNGGGSARSESAVSSGLKWIVRHQALDGLWKLDEPDMSGEGIQFVREDGDLAATALALLPLLGDGNTHLQSRNPGYAKSIERAFKALIAQQKTDGQLGDPLVHAMCALCLCEALCMTEDFQLKAPTQRAVNQVIKAWRPPAEGFRFQDRKADDLLVTTWQIQALNAAMHAGLFIPKATWKEINGYLDAVIDFETGSYGPPSQEALGMLCREYTGWTPRHPLLIRGVEKLRQQPPSPFLRDSQYYFHATEVLYHHNAEAWEQWNPPMRDLLVERQDPGDHPWRPNHAGSWAPEGDLWGREFGRLGVTSLSILTLEVYYRHAPLFRREMGAIKDDAIRNALN